MVQDVALDLLEGSTRLEPELVAQHHAGVLVGAERLCLPPLPVERNHQLAAEPFAQRLRCDQLLELPDSPSSRPQARSASTLASSASNRSRSSRPTAARDKRSAVQVPERLAAPEGQRLAKHVGRGLVVPSRQLLPPVFYELLEQVRIEVVVDDVQQVAVPRPHDSFAADHLAEPRDVDLDRVGRSRRRAFGPDGLDEVVDPDRASRVQQQRSEEHALQRAPERELPIAVVRLEPPQNPELHALEPLPQTPKLITSSLERPGSALSGC